MSDPSSGPGQLEQAHAAFDAGQFTEAERLGLAGLKEAHGAGDEKGMVPFSELLWNTALRLGQLDMARKHAEAMVMLGSKTDQHDAVAKGFAFLATYAEDHGDPGRAADYFLRAAEAFHRVEDWFGVGMVLSRAGSLAADRGDFETATHAHQDAFSALQKAGSPVGGAEQLCHLGALARQQGALGDAKELYEGALKIMTDHQLDHVIPSGHSFLGAVLVDLGDYDAAAEHYEQGHCLRAARGENLGASHLDLAWLAEKRGRIDEAVKTYALAAEAFEQAGEAELVAKMRERISGLGAG